MYNSTSAGIVFFDNPMYVICLRVDVGGPGVADASGMDATVVWVWYPARNARELNSARSRMISDGTPDSARSMAWTMSMTDACGVQ